MAQARPWTSFACILAALATALARRNVTTEVVLWIAASGRQLRENTGVVGLLVEAWPLVVDLQKSDSYSALVQQLEERYQEALPRSRVGMTALAEHLESVTGESATPYVLVHCSPAWPARKERMTRSPDSKAVDWIERPPRLPASSSCALMIRIVESEEQLNLSIQQNPTLLSDVTIATLMQEWTDLIEKGLANPAGKTW